MSEIRDPNERNDAAVIRQLSPLMFAFADKTFKFVSWALLLGLLQLATRQATTPYIGWLYGACTVVFGFALMMTLLELQVKDLSHLKVPRGLVITIKVMLFVLGFGLFMLIASPMLILDDVIAGLMT